MISYHDIAGGKLDAKAKQQQADALDLGRSKQALEIERKVWLNMPTTIDFLQQLASLRQELEQCAKNNALLGDNANCAVLVVQMSTIDKITTIAKHV